MSTEINPYRLIAPVYWDMYDDNVYHPGTVDVMVMDPNEYSD